MNGTPTMRFGEVLVVFEGPARIDWRINGQGDWTPEGLWPEPRHRELLDEHLDCGGSLLVVLDEARSVVPVLHDEWQRTPHPLRTALSAETTDEAAGIDDIEEVMELRVPFLDWLP
ncbi:hypothetical protein QMK28_16530, partial [Streptomyces sp. H27-D2]|nr:hypothetical protein [Streptomyces sp. H27-D2]